MCITEQKGGGIIIAIVYNIFLAEKYNGGIHMYLTLYGYR